MRDEISIFDKALSIRKWMLINSFLSLIMGGLVFFHLSYSYFQLNIYGSSLRNITIAYTLIFLLGTSIGRLLLRYKGYVTLLKIVEILFFLTFIVFFIWDELVIFGGIDTVHEDELLIQKGLISCFFIMFLSIKIYYLLRVFVLDYIDEKIPIFAWLVVNLLGFGIGCFFGVILINWHLPEYVLLLIPVFLLIIGLFTHVHLLDLENYSKEGENESKRNFNFRDDIFINYLNFSFVTVYLYFAYLVLVSIFGNEIQFQFLFVIIVVVSLGIGIIVGNKVNNVFWFYFSEMLFPIAMIIFIVLVNLQWHQEIEIMKVLVTSIPSFVFGFATAKSVENIFKSYEPKKRFIIFYISIFLMPLSILLALAFVDFTKILFYLSLYLLIGINIIVPGIYFVNQNVHYLKKILYFIFCLCFVPLIVYLHVNLNIPIDSTLFINNVKNFNVLYNKKYDSLFLHSNKNIEYQGRIIFETSDSAMKNLQRILLPMYMYSKEREGEILVINGYHKFYKNPMMTQFGNLTVIDYIPERKVDFNVLPIGGEGFFVEKGMLPTVLKQKRDAQYDIILDLPNLIDQQLYEWRFTKDFYFLVKRKLKPNGIFAQTFNLHYLEPWKLNVTKQHLESIFSSIIAFVVANQLMFIASDDGEKLKINQTRYSHLNELFKKNENMIYLFYNPNHVLWHYVEPKYLNIQHEHKKNIIEKFLFHKTKKEKQKVVPENYEINFDFILSNDKERIYLKNNLEMQYRYDKDLFFMLRKAEVAEEDQEYLKESDVIAEIYRKYAFRNDVKMYIQKIINLKEEFYLHLALQYEKEKNWEEAKKMYNAILKINNNAFEPNYRLGILNLTIQNIEEALKYMNIAIKMKSDDPRVHYQMGVLMFSNGKHLEALRYFEKSRQLKNESASLFLYMGMCNEAMGKLYEAKDLYIKAAFLDPNDSTIKASIERINEKIQKEINKWKVEDPKNQNEEEQGEHVPLPVNKSAYEYRITDQEAQRLKDVRN